LHRLGAVAVLGFTGNGSTEAERIKVQKCALCPRPDDTPVPPDLGEVPCDPGGGEEPAGTASENARGMLGVAVAGIPPRDLAVLRICHE